MSVQSAGYETATQKFQSLSLSIPLDASQFDYIKQFLGNLLNVQHTKEILSVGNEPAPKGGNGREILPDVAFPYDVWLRDNVCIKDVKAKVTMLTDINTMIEAEIDDFDKALDETTLLYYQKLLLAYKFHEPAPRNSFASDLNGDFSVKEELDEETDEYTMDEGKSLNRTISNQSSTTSSRTHLSFFSHSSNNNGSTTSNGAPNGNNSKRGSTSSKENILSRKRFSSFIGTNHSTNATLNNTNAMIANNNITTVNSEEEPSEEEHKKQQALNSLLSKSRIYNKLKKNRESSSSVNSNISGPSLPYSARNSVSTTGTMNSNPKSRRSSNITSPDNSDLKHPSFNPIPIFATYSLTQKQEIQKNKFDYYTQISILSHLIDKILHHLRLSHHTKSFKLMDFIKRFIFKFIVLDAGDMVISYGEIEAYGMYKCF